MSSTVKTEVGGAILKTSYRNNKLYLSPGLRISKNDVNLLWVFFSFFNLFKFLF